MPRGYDYGNARLRARRSRLLTESDYVSLLDEPTIDGVISALTDTPYKEAVDAALVRFDGVECVFEAVRRHLTATLQTVRSFYAGEPGDLIDLLLRHWDRHNLLTILRGHSQGVAQETITSLLIPAGQLDEAALRELARQPDMNAVIDLMLLWQLPHARALHAVRREGTPTLDRLELALDRSHYAALQDALEPARGNRRLVLEYIGTEVDQINMRMVLHLAEEPHLMDTVQRRYQLRNLRDLFVEFADALSARRLANWAADSASLQEVVQRLESTRYGDALSAAWRRARTSRAAVAALERALEQWRAAHIAAMFTRDPLGIAIPIGYMGSKEMEATNLRLIAQAVALSMDRAQVRRELIIISG